jgi:hypothetical protein
LEPIGLPTINKRLSVLNSIFQIWKIFFFGDFLLYLTYNKVIIKNDILTDKFIEIKDYLYERLTTYEYRFNSESFRNSFKNDVKYSIKREFNLEFEIICDNSNNIDSRIAEPEKIHLIQNFCLITM